MIGKRSADVFPTTIHIPMVEQMLKVHELSSICKPLVNVYVPKLSDCNSFIWVASLVSELFFTLFFKYCTALEYFPCRTSHIDMIVIFSPFNFQRATRQFDHTVLIQKPMPQNPLKKNIPTIVIHPGATTGFSRVSLLT
jgi:hypothetical protein